MNESEAKTAGPGGPGAGQKEKGVSRLILHLLPSWRGLGRKFMLLRVKLGLYRGVKTTTLGMFPYGYEMWAMANSKAGPSGVLSGIPESAFGPDIWTRELQRRVAALEERVRKLEAGA